MPNTAPVNQQIPPNLDQLTGRSGKSISEVIQSTTRAAGEFVLGRYHDQGRIDIKGRGNIVTDVDMAVEALASEVDLAFVTLGPRGSLVVSGSERIPVAADELHAVVDTTGAGDLYAAGVLFGLSRGATLDHAARLGSIAAAEVISHLGARPKMDLVAVAKSILG